jgi:tetratricopeptide (TPR) repeat protein
VLIELGAQLYIGDLYDPDPETGSAYMREAIDIFRQAGDYWGLGGALLNYSSMKFYRDGDAQATYDLAKESAASFRKSGDRYGVATSLESLGEYLLGEGSYLEGRPYLEEALGVFREFDDKLKNCEVLLWLGDVARALCEYERAETLYRESLSLRQEMGMGPFYLFMPTMRIGYTVLRLGDDEQAVTCFKQALELYKEGGFTYRLVSCLAGFAAVLVVRQEMETAARLYGTWETQMRGLLREGEKPGSNIFPITQMEINHYQAICRAQLGDAAFDATWRAGQSLSLEGAIAEALASV